MKDGMDCFDKELDQEHDCRLNEAIKMGLVTLAETHIGEGKDKEDAKEAKISLFKHMLSDPDAKALLVGMALDAGLSFLKYVKDAPGFSDMKEHWDDKTDEEKKTAVRNLAANVPLDVLSPTLDFTFLGTVIGHSINPDNDPRVKMVDKAMREIMEYLHTSKKGICESCGNLQNVRPVGKNGQEICKKCFDKNPAEIENLVNQMLRQRLGKDAPVAISMGKLEVPVGTSDEEIERLIQEKLNSPSVKEDITRFN